MGVFVFVFVFTILISIKWHYVLLRDCYKLKVCVLQNSSVENTNSQRDDISSWGPWG